MERSDGENAVSRRMIRTAKGMLALTITLALVGVALGVLAARGAYATPFLEGTLGLAGLTLYSALGFAILSRGANMLGFIFSVMALAAAGIMFGQELLRFSTANPGALVGMRYAAWVDSWLPIFVATPIALLFLLFPSGRVPTGRWRAVWWLWLSGAVAAVVGLMIRPGPLSQNIHGTNPFGIPALKEAANIVLTYGGVSSMVAALASVLALVVRMRRSTGEARQQIRLLAYVAAVGAVFFVVANLSSTAFIPDLAWVALLFTVLIGLPGSITIAVLRYRLYDIDVVISKTLVFGTLAAFITLVYVGIVVGAGALLGQHGGANVGLSIVATVVVAVAFQPVRERMTRVANHLVYGKRATPYEVLSEFAGRVGTTYATEDVLPRTARVIAEGTGAERADVWLRVGDQLRRSASWPPQEDGTELAVALPPGGKTLPQFQDVARAVPVLLQGALLGAVTVTKAPGDPLRHTEESLLDDLAGQAGLVLANARLTAELQAHLDQLMERSAELQVSRQRIVIAQDEERRRLERNIHDGAQQHLVALAVKLRLARSLVSRDPGKAGQMLTELRTDVGDALDTLSNLALGIYPPLLEEQGIAAALAAQYQRTDMPVRLNTDGTGRYPIELEAAVYFCTLEALQNIAKYAAAHAIDVRIGEDAGHLTFEVTDDGAGFDPATTSQGSGLNNMNDRLSVLGGDVTVDSDPGRGTTIRGRVPLTGADARAGVDG